ncbi:ABC transporter ATP-binding protein [Candidatus Liberibacter solanacearum]|uniref:ABC transporter ATP-binding protein n=1 Tax=Candidatus Liberibacter solanacearum TaxID=556287 RepID=UPI00387DBF70
MAQKNSKNIISLFRFQMLYLRYCLWFIIGELIAIFLYSGIMVWLPIITSVLLKKVGIAPYLWCVFMFLLLAIASSLRYYCATMLGERMILFMQRDIIAKLINFSPSFFSSRSHGDIFSTLVRDTERIKTTIGISMSIVLRNLLMALGSMYMMFSISIDLSLSIIGVACITIILFIIIMKFSRKKVNTLYLDEKKLFNIFSDMIKSMMVIQSFNAGKESIKIYNIQSEKTYKNFLKSVLIRASITCLAIFFLSCGISMVLLLGAHRVSIEGMSQEKLTHFLVYSFTFLGSIRSSSGFVGGISQAIASLKRLRDLMAYELDTPSPLLSLALPFPVLGSIVFRDVSFFYPKKSEKYILKNIDFTVRSGETVALVGLSGAGKTSFFSLLLRFYNPCSGSIEIDGIDLRNVSLKEIRRCIAWVPQNPLVISASVHDNIAIGFPKATREEVQNAAIASQAHQFISCLEEGYDTILGDDAIHLSAGQIQRIAIARAILKDAPILLLDEMSSALDIKNEKKIWEMLRAKRRGRTTIFASHRLSTIQDGDTVFILHDKVIVEKGKHEDLLKKSDLYAHYHAVDIS